MQPTAALLLLLLTCLYVLLLQAGFQVAPQDLASQREGRHWG